MTEIIVDGYADLAADAKLRGGEPDVVARELQANAGNDDRIVAVLEEWLVDEKPFDGVERYERVVSGWKKAETERAYLVVEDGTEAWLPKSCIRVYDAEPGTEISVPQHGLADFATDGGHR